MLRVAGEICGLHAQLLCSAELSLWARSAPASRPRRLAAFLGCAPQELAWR